ncbi:MAG: Fis family transcriptional regulator [Desulfobacterium sp.]|nr:Fis family transcriptional regulator [Desulfobacterium sp.]
MVGVSHHNRMEAMIEMMKDFNRIFREVTIRICKNPDLADALKECKNYLQTIMPVNMMHFSVMDPELSAARIVACVNDNGTVSIDDSWVIPLPKEVMEKVRDRMADHVCFRGDGKESYPYRIGAEIMGIPEPFSVLNIRLYMNDNHLGFLGLMARGKDQYLDEHAKLLNLLSPVFTCFLQNSLRYEEAILLIHQAREDLRYLQQDVKKISGNHVIGVNSGLKGVMNEVRQAASTNNPILLLGETGVGKGIIANAIHERSSRKEGLFLTVHCGSIPGSLLISELFGHDKGVFTGSTHDKRGCFERANGGMLFLDEIGALPLEVQTGILNVLSDKGFKRVGGSRTIFPDVRLIAASQQDLGAMVQKGVFLKELWSRINASPIVIPPLRSRKFDIPSLTNHFIHQKSIEMNLPVIPSLADGEMDYLLRYDWPGNVRELENVIERALILGQGRLLRFPDLGGFQRLLFLNHGSKEISKIPTLDEIMIQHIRDTLEKTGGRIEGRGGAADLLGIHYNTLRARMKKLGISFGRSR